MKSFSSQSSSPSSDTIADTDAVYAVDKRTVALVTLNISAELALADQEQPDTATPGVGDVSERVSQALLSGFTAAAELDELPAGVMQETFVHHAAVTGLGDVEDHSGSVKASLVVRLSTIEEDYLGRLASLANAQDIEAAMGADAANAMLIGWGQSPSTPEELESLALLKSIPEHATQELKSALEACLEDCDLFPLRVQGVEVEANLVHSFSGRSESQDVVRMWAGIDPTKQDLMGEWRERVGEPSRKSWRLRIVQTASALYSMRRPFEDSEPEFDQGPLLEAAEQGKTFFIEDINNMSPAVCAELYPFIDRYEPGDIAEVLESGGSVEIAPGFVIVASVDEDSPVGVNQALASRMV